MVANEDILEGMPDIEKADKDIAGTGKCMVCKETVQVGDIVLWYLHEEKVWSVKEAYAHFECFLKKKALVHRNFILTRMCK